MTARDCSASSSWLVSVLISAKRREFAIRADAWRVRRRTNASSRDAKPSLEREYRFNDPRGSPFTASGAARKERTPSEGPRG